MAPGTPQLERRSEKTEAPEFSPVGVANVIKVTLKTFCSCCCDLWVGLLAWDVFPGICGLPLLGNSFSVFVGFKIGPLVVKDIQQEKDSLKGAEQKLFL